MKPSVVILAKNEEARLPDCLASVAWSDDIVLIDDHSSDATGPIAAQAGARVLRRRMDGFASQRNYGIGQARNDWVLMLDADERVSPELAAELELLDPAANIAAYSIPFRNHLGRKWLRYGGLYPDRYVRLLDRRRARYGPKEIHETPVISGETYPLAGDLIHYTYRDVLDASNAVIALAAERFTKALWTDQAGERPRLVTVAARDGAGALGRRRGAAAS